MMMLVGVLLLGILAESKAIGDGVIKGPNGKIICVSMPQGQCTITAKDGTTSEIPGFANAKAETSSIGSAPAMNTLSPLDYSIVTDFFIFDGSETGVGFGVKGGRLYTKINGDCFVDYQYYYILENSTTYVTYSAWLSAIGQ